jgi:hypothetical protein
MRYDICERATMTKYYQGLDHGEHIWQVLLFLQLFSRTENFQMKKLNKKKHNPQQDVYASRIHNSYVFLKLPKRIK